MRLFVLHIYTAGGKSKIANKNLQIHKKCFTKIGIYVNIYTIMIVFIIF